MVFIMFNSNITEGTNTLSFGSTYSTLPTTITIAEDHM